MIEWGSSFSYQQADAHAWCEVWFPDSGWERVDPTAVVAPDRVNLGVNLFLERRAAAGQLDNTQGAFARQLARWPIFGRARLGWQTLSYAWDTRVLSFDGDDRVIFCVGRNGRAWTDLFHFWQLIFRNRSARSLRGMDAFADPPRRKPRQNCL